MKTFKHGSTAPFDHCICTGHKFQEEVRTRACVDINFKEVLGYGGIGITREALQFEYDLDGINGRGGGTLCPTCNRYPYRIIANPSYKGG